MKRLHPITMAELKALAPEGPFSCRLNWVGKTLKITLWPAKAHNCLFADDKGTRWSLVQTEY